MSSKNTGIKYGDLPRAAQLFRALGHPARLGILLRIVEGEFCVRELQAHLGRSQANISQHLTVLRERGLVIPQRRGNQVCYYLSDPRIASLVELAAELVDGLPERAQVGSEGVA